MNHLVQLTTSTGAHGKRQTRLNWGKRRRMKDRYRRLLFLPDIEGMKNDIDEAREFFPVFLYGCGLRAGDVPCESGIPKPLR